MIDGKTFQRQQIIVALGFDRAGEPFVLDMIQSTSENARTIADMLRRLIKRGMRTAKGVLIVCDGSKGITAAAQRVLGDRSVIQRCRVDKAENVASYLPKELQAQWRRRLFAAWKLDDYRQAKTQLLAYVAELKQINPSAAQSLLEGLRKPSHFKGLA
jgi:transposase-like protein